MPQTCEPHVKFRKIDKGPGVYSAVILAGGDYFGFIEQRGEGEFQAFSATGRLFAVSNSLVELCSLVKDAVESVEDEAEVRNRRHG